MSQSPGPLEQALTQMSIGTCSAMTDIFGLPAHSHTVDQGGGHYETYHHGGHDGGCGASK